uniref:VWFA domain-containing protein n=1 Tax=Panagrolaimus superbus TaxID=310955 RepID=A0A914Z3P8_9BILA
MWDTKIFTQIALLSLFVFISFYDVKGDGCFCSPNQTITPANWSITFGPPTTTGSFGGANCAANCSTIIDMSKDVDADNEYGMKINLVQCSGIGGSNILTIFEGKNVYIIFGACPSGIFKFIISYPHIYTFSWNLATPVVMTFVGEQMALPRSTTTSPPQSTLPYSGPFPYNPAISRLDFTIGLDTNAANQQYFNQCRDVINKIVSYFTYSPDFVRLSFMTFDPYAASGTGKFSLWSQNSKTLPAELNNLPFFPGNNSRYAEVLETYFFDKLEAFPLRNNTERIFIILTGTDAILSNDNAKLKNDINKYDIKFIFVNMNTNVSTNNSANFPFPNLKKITGTGSNKAHWFDYQQNENNAENILANLYFNGNNLCNRLNGNPHSLIPNAIPIYYSIPQDSTKLYCNYMENVQTYVNTDPKYTISVSIIKYNLSNKNDVLIITADGTEISRLTNSGANENYCLKSSNVTITLKTKSGLVFTGYQSHVAAVSDNDCFDTTLKYSL